MLTNLEEPKISCGGLTHLPTSIQALSACKLLELVVVRCVHAGRLHKLHRQDWHSVDGMYIEKSVMMMIMLFIALF